MPPRPLCITLIALILSSIALSAEASEKAAFRWRDDAKAGTATLFYGEQPVLQYAYASDDSTPERTHETYKVFHHVYGPGTGEVITKGPGGKYTHHRGLFVGWNKTHVGEKTYDFWHMKNVRQKHASFAQLAADEQQGTMTAIIHWNDPEGHPVIVERRTVSAKMIQLENGPAWQIDWKTELNSEQGEIQLDGDRQHAGFQFRAAQEVADHNSARYIRPESFPQQEQAVEVNDRTGPDKHIDLGWLAMSYPLGENRYTVEYFEDPTVPRPSRYSERPYGRFGAFFQATLTPQKPLSMHYRLIVSEGELPERDAIQQRYEQFAAEFK
ncbi:MAG: DUF6807 family protein [Planctomycetaceae bacterium]